VAQEALRRKGLSVIGLVDCLSQPLLFELHESLATGLLREANGGGLLLTACSSGTPKRGGELLIVPGCEVELLLWDAPVHFLIYLPGLDACHELRRALSSQVRNIDLGSQRAHEVSPALLAQLAHRLGGVCGLAHAFTPHRGYFGSTGGRLDDMWPAPGLDVNPDANPDAISPVDFVEMGLSADTALAGLLPELAPVPLLASSDAHGAVAIAREATEFAVHDMSFAEIVRALRGEGGRCITAYYGLDPRLGKYHRTACHACGFVAAADEPAHLTCPACGETRRLTHGVLDRILTLSAQATAIAAEPCRSPAAARRQAGIKRPPYHHQIPLSFIPSVGPATRERLLERFGSEIAVLHEVPQTELAAAAGRRAAEMILAARRGELTVTAGGGGAFGRAAGPPLP
jgi:uncharacterized protein (TIGR00375 family)